MWFNSQEYSAVPWIFKLTMEICYKDEKILFSGNNTNNQISFHEMT